MSFSKLKVLDKEAVLAKLVLVSLQGLGGQANRQDIREKILEENEEIAKYAAIVKTSRKTGASYSPFEYNFNFALKNLKISGFAEYSRSSRLVRLTSKGMQVNANEINYEKDIIPLCAEYWEKQRAEGKKQKPDDDSVIEEEDRLSNYDDEFRDRLLGAIQKMSPEKFEIFSRALLSKMGIEFTEKGTQISNDGGIDGYGYCRTDDFRTSRVVIQCKRWQNSVGVSEINSFIGAMNVFRADYGVFITNSRYTASAREAARAGTPVTLIDGNDLVRLVKKYELYVIPVQTYILDNFYDV
jgi:restriction system protein